MISWHQAEKIVEIWLQNANIQILALLLANCVAFVKSQSQAVPQFLHLSKGWGYAA